MTRIELAELWQKRMSDFEESPLTGTQWCREQNIPLSRFHYWKRKLRFTHQDSVADRWMAVQREDRSRVDALFIQLGSAKIQVYAGFNPDLLADVIRVLRSL